MDRKICSHKCITILNPRFYSLLGLQELTKDTHAMVMYYIKINVPYILSSDQWTMEVIELDTVLITHVVK